jgi:hypothetical protein
LGRSVGLPSAEAGQKMTALAHLLKPSSWSGPAFLELGRSLALLFLAAAGLWLAVGLGRRIKKDADGPLALALGTAAFAGAAFVTGLLGLWPLGLWLASAALAAAGWSRAPRDLKIERHWSLLAIGWCALHVLLRAWAPPTGWDALSYHLSIPRFYLEEGGITRLPWLLHSNWPHLMEVLYALPLSLGLSEGPALIHAALSLALVVSVWGESPWAAAILAAQPVFMEVAGQPHADGALALFCWLSALTLHRGGSSALAGFLAGLAFACKLQGAAPAAALLLWTAWKRGPREAALFLFAAAIPAAPWLTRSWLWPFGPWGDAAVSSWLTEVSLWRFPRDAGLLWRYGPQWLLPALAALALWRREPPPRLAIFLTLPAAALFLLVFRYHEAWRFLLPALPMLCLAAAHWARRWAPLLVFPALFLSSGNELYAVSGARSGLMPGLPSREVYLRRSLPHYAFFRDVPADYDVLLWREVRGYWLPAKWRWGDPRLQSQVRYDSPEEAHGAMLRLGVSHVLLNEANALYGPNQNYYRVEWLETMDELLKRCARIEKREGPLALHRLEPACARRR